MSTCRSQCNCPFCNQFNNSLYLLHLKHFCPFPAPYVLTSSYTSFSLAVGPHLSSDLSPRPQWHLLTSCSPFTTQTDLLLSHHLVRVQEGEERELSPTTAEESKICSQISNIPGSLLPLVACSRSFCQI
uniref:Uncharacterized protein n=1 Tax=Buteo japonicus TaxID=224669 RepID=A0A8C0BZ51_9AVES